MNVYRFIPSAAALVRLATGADLLTELQAACAKLGVRAGSIEAIGAVSTLALGYYHQDRKEYETLRFEGRWEIVSATGNVSLAEGEPFVHVHVVASGADGRCVGGHLVPGCTVFAAEATIVALEAGDSPVREPDDVTGLRLWR